ncbi:hypothetical protein [Methylicorpusculum sp.]|uniref:hypothetical protein n=1 Tax=Methylicorpusculum sp. TaxID=2713644 RepID=UPI00271C0968|nr:hypothetical protein [Methylicorpusculum sp.]MDO8845366.1 hypothetical protein [Methylicorpusculum sp.]
MILQLIVSILQNLTGMTPLLASINSFSAIPNLIIKKDEVSFAGCPQQGCCRQAPMYASSALLQKSILDGKKLYFKKCKVYKSEYTFLKIGCDNNRLASTQ